MPRRGAPQLAGAGASAAVLAVTWLASFHVESFQRADQKTFLAFYDVTFEQHWPHVNRALHILISLCNPSHYVYLAAFSIGLALVRRAFPAACAAGVVLIGANLTTLVLKAILPEPQVSLLSSLVVPVPYPRWPSGHGTAAMSLVVAIVLAAPPRIRPLTAATGAIFAAAVGYAVMAFGTHLPSDVVGGFLVACVWGFFALAGLALVNRDRAAQATPSRGPVSIPEALAPPTAALVILGGAAGIVVLISPPNALSYASAHMLVLAGGLAIAALSAVISTAVALGVRGLSS